MTSSQLQTQHRAKQNNRSICLEMPLSKTSHRHSHHRISKTNKTNKTNRPSRRHSSTSSVAYWVEPAWIAGGSVVRDWPVERAVGLGREAGIPVAAGVFE